MKADVKLFILLCVSVVALWLSSLWLIIWCFNDWPSRGQFGDLFGAVNALFSGLAFAGLIYTILLQKEELTKTQAELDESKNMQVTNLKLVRLNSLVSAYTTILSPGTGIKNRMFEGEVLHEEEIKLRFLRRVRELENLTESKE
jgi:hypothetical protein